MTLWFLIGLIKNWKLNFLKEKQFLVKIENLRYGENPHQSSSIYVNDFNDMKFNLKLNKWKRFKL